MKKPQEVLPSDRTFGLFFAFVFVLVGSYSALHHHLAIAVAAFTVALFFVVLAVFKPFLLHGLNKLWMRLGLILGAIVSPVVLGILFFGVFTPIAFIMRIFGRDELGIRAGKQNSYWKERAEQPSSESHFKNQF